MRTRLLAPALLVLVASNAGCYLSYGPSVPGDAGDAGPPIDLGPDAHPDLGPDALVDLGPDALVDLGPDALVDLGPDARIDSGSDGGVVGRDAEPPLGPPPDPSRCRTTPAILPFEDPVLEHSWPPGPVVHSESLNVCMTPLVVDLDPDGTTIEPEIAFVSYPTLGREEPPGVLRIWKPKTGETISNPATDVEQGVLEATGHLAAGDLDGDGRPELVGIGTYSATYAYRGDGTLMWESPYPLASERGPRLQPSIGGGPALADLEGDGTIEVVIGRTVLDGRTGERRWTGPVDAGRGHNATFLGPLSCVADLDGDGAQEVIAGKTAYRANGDVFWTTAHPDGFCAVANVVTSTPGPEVILVSSGYIRVLDGLTGVELWVRDLVGRVRDSIGGAPTIADFDADGRQEFGVAHGGAFGVYDMDCRAVGPGCLGVGLKWQSATNDDSSAGTGSSVFDFNGDGAAEVVYNDQQYFRVYDGASGGELFRRNSSSRTRTENPVIADVDNDGDAEIVFGSNNEAYFTRLWWTEAGVYIWGDARGAWVGARRIWNQHAYHVSNVEENGAIPTHEVPSWTGLNAYRQNLREGADVLVTPDLWGGRGTYSCASSGAITLRVNVQNYGLERIGEGVVVSFWRGAPARGGVRLGQALTTTRLEPGGAEIVDFSAPWTLPVKDYYAVLDNPELPVGGSVAECREDNNTVLFWRPDCR
jgi:hypothetical protein